MNDQHADFGNDFPDIATQAYEWRGGELHPAGPVIYETTTTGRRVVGGTPQTPAELEDQLGADLPSTIRTQDELLTALDLLLDDSLHDEHCYVHPHDTVCVCIIGRVRAVLPPCGAVKPAPGTGGAKMWPCLRSAHPASPDLHYFGEE